MYHKERVTVEFDTYKIYGRQKALKEILFNITKKQVSMCRRKGIGSDSQRANIA